MATKTVLDCTHDLDKFVVTITPQTLDPLRADLEIQTPRRLLTLSRTGEQLEVLALAVNDFLAADRRCELRVPAASAS